MNSQMHMKLQFLLVVGIFILTAFAYTKQYLYKINSRINIASGQGIKTIQTDSIGHCSTLCSLNPDCWSITTNSDEAKAICSLNPCDHANPNGQILRKNVIGN